VCLEGVLSPVLASEGEKRGGTEVQGERGFEQKMCQRGRKKRAGPNCHLKRRKGRSSGICYSEDFERVVGD